MFPFSEFSGFHHLKNDCHVNVKFYPNYHKSCIDQITCYLPAQQICGSATYILFFLLHQLRFLVTSLNLTKNFLALYFQLSSVLGKILNVILPVKRVFRHSIGPIFGFCFKLRGHPF